MSLRQPGAGPEWWQRPDFESAFPEWKEGDPLTAEQQRFLIRGQRNYHAYVSDRNDEDSPIARARDEYEQERNEALLMFCRDMPMRPAERRAMADLRELHFDAITREGLTYGEAFEEAKSAFENLHGRPPADFPDTTGRPSRILAAAGRILKHRRRREADEAASWRRQAFRLEGNPTTTEVSRALADYRRRGAAARQGFHAKEAPPPADRTAAPSEN